LFGVGRSTITEHINNILNSGELDKDNTVGKTDINNSKKPVKIYNLDMIIAVGYRVNSKKATNFRIWATKVLKEYMIKGVVMDDERLKNPNYIFGEDYFEETLERIRNIRSRERRFYQQIIVFQVKKIGLLRSTSQSKLVKEKKKLLKIINYQDIFVI